MSYPKFDYYILNHGEFSHRPTKDISKLYTYSYSVGLERDDGQLVRVRTKARFEAFNKELIESNLYIDYLVPYGQETLNLLTIIPELIHETLGRHNGHILTEFHTFLRVMPILHEINLFVQKHGLRHSDDPQF